MLLLAESPEPISLFALLIQGGSFALLAYIIIFGLPALHKMIAAERKEERADFATSLAKLTDEGKEARIAFAAGVKEQRTDFAAALTSLSSIFRQEAVAERVACEKHFETLAGVVTKGNEATLSAIMAQLEQRARHQERDDEHATQLKKALEVAKQAQDLVQKQA